MSKQNLSKSEFAAAVLDTTRLQQQVQQNDITAEDLQASTYSQSSLGKHISGPCRGVSWLSLPTGNSQIAEGIPPPTASTWGKTKGEFKKVWEVLTFTLK